MPLVTSTEMFKKAYAGGYAIGGKVLERLTVQFDQSFFDNGFILAMPPLDVHHLCDGLERNPHGNVQVSLIESEKLFSALVKDKLAQRKKAIPSATHSSAGLERLETLDK